MALIPAKESHSSIPPKEWLKSGTVWVDGIEREAEWETRAVVPNLGSPEVLGLQLPEIPASTARGEGFWELQSKNIWRTQGSKALGQMTSKIPSKWKRV